jgi:hypothetical protein
LTSGSCKPVWVVATTAIAVVAAVAVVVVVAVNERDGQLELLWLERLGQLETGQVCTTAVEGSLCK